MATTRKKTKRVSGTKRKRSPLQKAYSDLTKVKGKSCNGKATKTQVRDAARKYIKRAVAAGQTRKEATRKANRITSKKCAK